MREILFRGKRVCNGVWLYGGFHSRFGRAFIIGCSKSFRFDGMDVIPETVGQYTGLTDVNGKKIFEGDILSVLVNEMAYPEEGSFEEDVLGRRKIPTGNKIRTVWTVEHRICNSSGSGFFVFGKDRRFSRIITGNTIYNAKAEVIGNIHDNPELLEVTENA